MSSQMKQSKTEDISLYALVNLFLKNWITLCICGFSFATIALIWSIYQPNVYKAETVLMPASSDQGGLGGLAGNLGGLAAMAGVNLPEGKSDNSKLALELIKSQSFLGKFIEDNQLHALVIGAVGWNQESNQIVYNLNIYDDFKQEWIRKAKFPRKTIPSTQEVYQEFVKLIEIEQDPKSKFVKLSVDFYSPHIAAQWARQLVGKLNEHIRLMDRDEATQSIVYLEQLAREANVSELRKSFSALMEEQLKSKMLTEVRKDYVFKVIDPAVAPELKDKPKRAIIVIIAGFLGGIIGMIIILFRAGRQSYLSK